MPSLRWCLTASRYDVQRAEQRVPALWWHWTGLVILAAYLAGIATPFVLYALLCAVVIATNRGSGTQCMVCDHLDIDIEDRRMRAYIWVRKAWHRVWWRSRRWHKEATVAYLAKWRRP